MNTKYLILNSRDELYRVEISKIVYFEGGEITLTSCLVIS